MRYNVLINSKNKVGGDNPSNYKYNFDFSSFEDGEYELGFNFNTNPLKTVQAIPVYTGATTTATFSSNTLSITNTSLNYEYALSNGTPYTTGSSGDLNAIFSSYMAFENSTRMWVSLYETYNASTGLANRTTHPNVNNISIPGEWLGIKLPYKLKLTSFILQPSSNALNSKVKNYVLIGSNDGNIWNSILVGTAQNTMNSQVILTENNKVYYDQYRIIVKSVYTAPTTPLRPDIVCIQSFFLSGKTAPTNNASLLQIELENLGATKNTYTTTVLTSTKSSNVIGTILFSDAVQTYYNSPYNYNSLVNILSKPESSEITIKLKNSDDNLFNIGGDYLMLLSFLKKQ